MTTQPAPSPGQIFPVSSPSSLPILCRAATEITPEGVRRDGHFPPYQTSMTAHDCARLPHAPVTLPTPSALLSPPLPSCALLSFTAARQDITLAPGRGNTQCQAGGDNARASRTRSARGEPEPRRHCLLAVGLKDRTMWKLAKNRQ